MNEKDIKAPAMDLRTSIVMALHFGAGLKIPEAVEAGKEIFALINDNFIEPLKQSVKDDGYDTDFYYFKSTGKWKYEGAGFFPEGPEGGDYYEVNHAAIFEANDGMPGISTDGLDYTILVVPRENCKVKTAYPRLLKGTST